MPLLRIVKKYNRLSSVNGLVEVDKVEFKCRADAERFLSGVKTQRGIPYDIIDAEWVTIDLGGGAEIIENATGSYTGKVTESMKHLLN